MKMTVHTSKFNNTALLLDNMVIKGEDINNEQLANLLLELRERNKKVVVVSFGEENLNKIYADMMLIKLKQRNSTLFENDLGLTLNEIIVLWREQYYSIGKGKLPSKEYGIISEVYKELLSDPYKIIGLPYRELNKDSKEPSTSSLAEVLKSVKPTVDVLVFYKVDTMLTQKFKEELSEHTQDDMSVIVVN